MNMSLVKKLSRFNPIHRIRMAEQQRRDDQKEVLRHLQSISRRLTQLEKTVLRQHEALQSQADMQEKVDQSLAQYGRDAEGADDLPRLRPLLQVERVRKHAAAAVARATLETDPTPHIVIEDLLPDEVCDELVAAVPASSFFPSQNAGPQEIDVPFALGPQRNQLIWSFFYDVAVESAVLPAVIEKFRPALDEFVQKHWPDRGSFTESAIELHMLKSRLLLRRPGYRITPHRDPRWVFITGLIYLQRRDDPHTYGTQFYRLRHEREHSHHSPLWIDEAECEFVKEVPALRNSAVIFLNSTGAHGAFIPPDAPPDTERFLYQVQFGPDKRTKRSLIAESGDPAGPEQTARPQAY
jgi:hypothetical protein